jgi:hypothetical protein
MAVDRNDALILKLDANSAAGAHGAFA